MLEAERLDGLIQMATNLWGEIYYKDALAGILSREPGNLHVFTYDEGYLRGSLPAISHTLPLRSEPYLSRYGLHPFFDNLCSEGWLKNAQARALELRGDDRLQLLLAFGTDLAGAVSVIDPEPSRDVKIDRADPENVAALAARASLCGVQPKLGAVKEGRSFRPAGYGERATHIAKLPSAALPGIQELEYLTTRACAALLREDAVAEMTIAPLRGLEERALLVRRFDRTPGGERLHFEEFNQLLGNRSEDKYEGCYEDMADFIIRNGDVCMRAECDTLFRRVMACVLTGNTDAHLKNFAMMHTGSGLRLAPCYDLLAAACYPPYQTMALGIDGTRNLRIDSVGPEKMALLGRLFGLPEAAVTLAVADFARRLDGAHAAVDSAKDITRSIKDELHRQMEERWKGTFESIGDCLSRNR